MAIVRNIAVAITARTQKFKAQMKSAGKSTTRFAKVTQAAGVSVRSLTVAAAAAVVGIGVLVKKHLEYADALAKTARGLDINVGSLEAFHLAADLAGLDVSQMEKALKRMTKGIADADNALATQVRAFDVLGISVESLIDLDAEAQFKIIAEQVKDLGNNTRTAGAVMDIFGTRVGRDLLPLLLQGADSIEAARDRLNAFGTAMDDIQAGRIESVNDSLSRLGGMFRGLANALAGGILIKMDGVVRAFEHMTGGSRQVANALAQQTAEALALADAQAALRDGIEANAKALEREADALRRSLDTPFDKIMQEINRVNFLFDNGKISVETYTKAIEKLKRELKALEEETPTPDELPEPPEVPEVEPDDFRTMFDDAPRAGSFRQVDLRNVALGGPGTISGDKERQNQLDKLLELSGNMLRALENPPPTTIRFN